MIYTEALRSGNRKDGEYLLDNQNLESQEKGQKMQGQEECSNKNCWKF
jgi:hypothetical protein